MVQPSTSQQKTDGALHVLDPQHDMVDALDLNGGVPFLTAK
jgi:hypothetical protein